MSVENKDLVVTVDTNNLAVLFEGDGAEHLLHRIKEEVSKNELDVSTAKGRQAIASLAYKVARSKTYLDELGKQYISALKEKVSIVDGARRKLRDGCDEIKDDVRRPLTEYEEAEERRVSSIREKIDRINLSAVQNFDNSNQINGAIKEVKGIAVDESFAEFADEAAKVKSDILEKLEAKLIIMRHNEKEAEEKARAERERVEREQKEREERIAREAAEKARIEAEEEAKRKAEEDDRRRREEIERHEREKAEARKAAEEAKAAAERAEKEKAEAAERAEREKKEAFEKAERDKREAVEAEKRRQEEERKREAEETRKREENKRHRNKIIGEIIEDLKSSNISEKVCRDSGAKELIEAILDGKIRHLKIEF